MSIELYHGDCLEVMTYIASKSIDCIICDLPYGTTAINWDEIIDFDLLWEQYNRILKDDSNIILFSGGGSLLINYMLVMLNNINIS